MAIGLEIKVRDNVSPTLTFVLDQLRGDGVNKVLGRAAVNLMKAHLRKLNTERPNKLGGKRTHFYNQAASATFSRENADGFTVTVAHTGFAQRYYGGPITPKRVKFLTIPFHADAHGRAASTFGDSLSFAMHPQLGRVLIRTRTEKAKGRRKKGDPPRPPVTTQEVLYLLRRKVIQKGDTSVIPTVDEFRAALLKAAQQLLDTQSRRGGAIT